ncbi:MAG: malonic semialdehyde reductase [Proteobacteria bacterium]|nr:malonic semialdehyde reductase [Pseudomonadota bacterium]
MSEEEALAASRARIDDVRNRIDRLDNNALDLIFREARSHNWWTDRDVSDDQLREIWDVMKYGTTSANTLPARILFIRSKEAKEKLAPCLNPANVDKTMLAPVTALIATDLNYFDNFEKLYPPRPEMKERHASDAAFAAKFGLQQGTLQGAYFIIAARALGLDCGAMGGFDAAKADAAFLASTSWKSNFLCNIGYADLSGIKGPRLYRYAFDEVCKVI